MNVNSLLIISYEECLVFGQLAKVAVQNPTLFYLLFICVAEKRL